MSALYQSATSMFALSPDVWPKENIKWMVQRCAFLIELRSNHNEFFHGMDVDVTQDFNEEIERILRESFLDELEYFIKIYPEIYNEIWYDLLFNE